MENRFSLNTVFQIWDDKHGDRIEVGEDMDALELVEIRYYTDDGDISSRITMPREQARCVHEALGKYLEMTKPVPPIPVGPVPR